MTGPAFTPGNAIDEDFGCGVRVELLPRPVYVAPVPSRNADALVPAPIISVIARCRIIAYASRRGCRSHVWHPVLPIAMSRDVAVADPP